MRVDPQRSDQDIHAELESAAERQYGTDRAVELRANLRHLARMMALVGERDLGLAGDAPDTSGIPERNVQ